MNRAVIKTAPRPASFRPVRVSAEIPRRHRLRRRRRGDVISDAGNSAGKAGVRRAASAAGRFGRATCQSPVAAGRLWAVAELVPEGTWSHGLARQSPPSTQHQTDSSRRQSPACYHSPEEKYPWLFYHHHRFYLLMKYRYTFIWRYMSRTNKAIELLQLP